jgi:hypothetical protein
VEGDHVALVLLHNLQSLINRHSSGQTSGKVGRHGKLRVVSNLLSYSFRFRDIRFNHSVDDVTLLGERKPAASSTTNARFGGTVWTSYPTPEDGNVSRLLLSFMVGALACTFELFLGLLFGLHSLRIIVVVGSLLKSNGFL